MMYIHGHSMVSLKSKVKLLADLWADSNLKLRYVILMSHVISALNQFHMQSKWCLAD